MVRERVRERLFGTAQRVLMVSAAAAAAAVFFVITFGAISPAAALPSFARQTGQPCGTCHTDFPALTPYGRRFKLLGYTTGGGPYRTTPFREFPRFKKDPLDSYVNADDAQSNARKKSDPGMDGQSTSGQSDTWVPPISMMAIVGYTHTQAPQDATGSPYNSNDNLVVAPVSVFYGGAITEHIGAFAQLSWNNAPFGAPDQADPYATRQVTWDNTDIRYSNTAKLGNTNVIYGITANNNPTVQDLWNTTPAWAFPYNASNIAASGPTSSTLIEGALAQRVAGVGAYAWINDLLYLELTGYRAINFDALLKLGPDPFQGPGVSPGKMVGIAPYWRVAVEPHWGNHWLEFGAFGMSAQVNPFTTVTDANGFYLNQTFQETDRYSDIGFDTQYQYQGPNYWFTLRGTYIHEKQTLDASSLNFGTNPSNSLDTFKALASLAYGSDNRVVLTGQYFNSRGTSDAILYANNPEFSPNSEGYIFEVAYIPFISSQAPVWPWANARVGLQYTYYNKFNGDTVSAHDNNSLFAYIWFAM